MQRAQFDRGLLVRHDQVGHALLVAQEQVLGMAARHRAPQRPGILDRESRGMADGLVRDAERIEADHPANLASAIRVWLFVRARRSVMPAA